MKKTLIPLLLLLLAVAGSHAQTYVPTSENLRAREEFSQHRLGIFLHWGIYAMYGQGEWYLNTGKLNKDAYAKAAEGFYPSKFNAAEWIAAFKDAGAGYITFTSRHHDGFSLFKTAASDYNVVDGTPFGRDIVGELARACADADIDLHLYYSTLDWIREDYPIGNTGRDTGRKGDQQDYNHYFAFMKQQVKELLTQYPNVKALWFDGIWDHEQDPDFDWRMPEFYRYIHSIKNDCLIGNNHHIAPFDGEDFQLFERDLPGENKAGFSGQSTISRLPLEMCEPMNDTWGYRVYDWNYKSVKQLAHLLVRAAAKNSNLLLNIGPMANGEIPALALERLAGLGQWMRGHSIAIDGTTSTTIPEQPWGVTTQNANALFLHILSPEALPLRSGVYKVVVPLPQGMTLPRKGAVALLTSGTPLSYEISKDGFLTLTLPQSSLEEIDTVVRLAR